jgi:cell division protein FtsX
VGADEGLATIDWATIASFATALGTLVLAVATFSAVRSSNRSARIAEASFQVNLRPVLVTSRLEDPIQKIR